MQSVGEACFPVFVVSFPDTAYRSNMVGKEELEEWLFTGEDSVRAYYDTASYGRLHLDGDVWFYEAQQEIASYENDYGFEELVMEVLTYYDEEIDFSTYDRNGDHIMDSLVISVPSGGDVDFGGDVRRHGTRIRNFVWMESLYGIISSMMSSRMRGNARYIRRLWSMNLGTVWVCRIIINTIPKIGRDFTVLREWNGWMIPRGISHSFLN